ncbi:MAG TPA: tetratricopeptide repeat protein [Casimicrobiaceae bacterium]|nr:tetratricopeptide repeat protein [Casimicrobiaceae bacterium]
MQPPANSNPAAQFAQAAALLSQGKAVEAIECLERAVALRPDYAEAHLMLAQALRILGRIAESAASLEKGVALMPNFAEAHSNLGLLYGELGKRDAAEESFRKAIAIKPGLAWAHSNLGNILTAQGKFPAAIESYRKALAVEPNHVETWVNLANTLYAQDDVDAAVDGYRKALAIKPDHALAWLNIGAPLQAQGNLDAAIESFRKALSLRPDYAEAHSGLLFLMSFDPHYSPGQRLAEAQRYGAAVMARARPYQRWKVDAGTGAANAGPLRVGLVSGDLRTHPVGFFVESIIAHLDPNRIELVAYTTLSTEDETTARIKPRFAAWNSIAGLSDQAAAARIHGDGIHILVDLAGHTAHNRLPILAWKPAPVQASWLGYFATTGVPTIDYLLADRESVPESIQDEFTETIWYLPDTRFCFTPPADSTRLQPAPPPALRNGSITFGCFQNPLKLNDQVLAAWGRILAALPDARLLVLNRHLRYAPARARMADRLSRSGIAPERLAMVGVVPRDEYLATHAGVDIILDTFPYPGATTTCEALWMGVPTLTLAGDTLVSRQGASLLRCVGLDDWVASDVDDYVARALAHAADVDGLAALRSELRQRALASPLFDATRFARNFEAALEGMWGKAIRDGKPVRDA